MSEIEINEMIKWLVKQKELNQTLASNTPDYISYHSVYIGKVHAYIDTIEYLELLLDKQI